MVIKTTSSACRRGLYLVTGFYTFVGGLRLPSLWSSSSSFLITVHQKFGCRYHLCRAVAIGCSCLTFDPKSSRGAVTVTKRHCTSGYATESDLLHVSTLKNLPCLGRGQEFKGHVHVILFTYACGLL